MKFPILNNWSFVTLDPYTPPEAGNRLIGDVYGHPEYQDGKSITTSKPLCRRKVGGKEFVCTQSGSTYELGEPDPQYVAYCELNNIDPWKWRFDNDYAKRN